MSIFTRPFPFALGDEMRMLSLCVCGVQFILFGVALTLTYIRRGTFPIRGRLWVLNIIIGALLMCELSNIIAHELLGITINMGIFGVVFGTSNGMAAALYSLRTWHLFVSFRIAQKARLLAAGHIQDALGLRRWFFLMRRAKSPLVMRLATGALFILMLLCFVVAELAGVGPRNPFFFVVCGAGLALAIVPAAILTCLLRGISDDGYLIRFELRMTGWSTLAFIILFLVLAALLDPSLRLRLGIVLEYLIYATFLIFHFIVPLRASYEASKIIKWRNKLSLPQVLGHSSMLLQYKQFLHSEFSQENLDFWMQVRELKRLLDADKLTEELAYLEAKRIFALFVSKEAPLQINLSYQVRQRTAQLLKDYEIQRRREGMRSIHYQVGMSGLPLRSSASEGFGSTNEPATGKGNNTAESNPIEDPGFRVSLLLDDEQAFELQDKPSPAKGISDGSHPTPRNSQQMRAKDRVVSDGELLHRSARYRRSGTPEQRRSTHRWGFSRSEVEMGRAVRGSKSAHTTPRHSTAWGGSLWPRGRETTTDRPTDESRVDFIFKDATQAVYRLMDRDTLPRFRKTLARQSTGRALLQEELSKSEKPRSRSTSSNKSRNNSTASMPGFDTTSMARFRSGVTLNTSHARSPRASRPGEYPAGFSPGKVQKGELQCKTPRGTRAHKGDGDTPPRSASPLDKPREIAAEPFEIVISVENAESNHTTMATTAISAENADLDNTTAAAPGDNAEASSDTAAATLSCEIVISGESAEASGNMTATTAPPSSGESADAEADGNTAATAAPPSEIVISGENGDTAAATAPPSCEIVISGEDTDLDNTTGTSAATTDHAEANGDTTAATTTTPS